MCGVFYVDDDTAREIEKTIRLINILGLDLLVERRG